MQSIPLYCPEITEKMAEEQAAFCYRIYQSMSVGDFVVAIRCNDPEVPFEVASMLRRRKFELKRPAVHRSIRRGIEETELCTNFVFYKTYTLMSLNTHIIPVSSDSEEAPDISVDPEKRRFVLRCVLSNKYWSHEKDIEKKYKPEQNLNISSYLRLNGRYDFTVTLSEQAFLYIHPKLVRYKIGSPKPEPSSEDVAVKTDPDEKKICDYIISLMKDKYISPHNSCYNVQKQCNMAPCSTLFGLPENVKMPRNQAVSGLIVHIGFVSKITS